MSSGVVSKIQFLKFSLKDLLHEIFLPRCPTLAKPDMRAFGPLIRQRAGLNTLAAKDVQMACLVQRGSYTAR